MPKSNQNPHPEAVAYLLRSISNYLNATCEKEPVKALNQLYFLALQNDIKAKDTKWLNDCYIQILLLIIKLKIYNEN